MTAATTVLVVEDYTDLRELLAEVLGAAGYTVLTAADGRTAMEAAASHRGAIEVLLTDIVMPSMFGTDLANEIRRSRPDVRVLFMSGHARPAIPAGAPLPPDATLLQKPFLESELLEKLGRVIAEPVHVQG